MIHPARFSQTILRCYFTLLGCPFLFSAMPVPEKTIDNKKFSSADYKVAIIFPGEYTEQEDKETGKSTLKVSCNLNNELFYLGVTRHSVKMENYEKMAEISLNAFATALSGKIRNQHTYTQNKKNGLEALIWLPEQKSFVITGPYWQGNCNTRL